MHGNNNACSFHVIYSSYMIGSQIIPARIKTLNLQVVKRRVAQTVSSRLTYYCAGILLRQA